MCFDYLVIFKSRFKGHRGFHNGSEGAVTTIMVELPLSNHSKVTSKCSTLYYFLMALKVYEALGL
jgi:hypothetical protein